MHYIYIYIYLRIPGTQQIVFHAFSTHHIPYYKRSGDAVFTNLMILDLMYIWYIVVLQQIQYTNQIETPSLLLCVGWLSFIAATLFCVCVPLPTVVMIHVHPFVTNIAPIKVCHPVYNCAVQAVSDRLVNRRLRLCSCFFSMCWNEYIYIYIYCCVSLRAVSIAAEAVFYARFGVDIMVKVAVYIRHLFAAFRYSQPL